MNQLRCTVLLATLILAHTTTSVFAQGGGKHARVDETKPGHSHAAASLHGGQVVMTPRHHFEVVYRPDGARVFVYDAHQKPLPARGVQGTARIITRRGATTSVPLRYVPASAGQQDALEASFAFAGTRPGEIKVVFDLRGLSDASERATTFRSTFGGVVRGPASAPRPSSTPPPSAGSGSTNHPDAGSAGSHHGQH